MKKLIFVLLIICCSFLKLDKIFAEDPYKSGDVRYEILSADYDVASNSIILKGWAIVRGFNHGKEINSSYPKYAIRVKNVSGGNFEKEYPAKYNKDSYSSKSNSSDTKIDLTCTLFTNSSNKPECFDVLVGAKNYTSNAGETATGQSGVKLMLDDTATSNFYYRNIGFEVAIPLSELTGSSDGAVTCEPNTNTIHYTMQILIDIGTKKFKSNDISIYKEVVRNYKLADNLIFQNIPSSVRVIVSQGRLRLQEGVNPIPYSNMDIWAGIETYQFTSGLIYKVEDVKSTPLSTYAIQRGIPDMIPYRVNYYSLYVKKIEGTKWVLPGSLSDKYYYGPATWIIPDDGNGLHTHIVVPANNCIPDEEDIDYRKLSCHPDNPPPILFKPNPIVFPAKEGTFLSNTACIIKGEEDTNVTLPSYPGTLKAGMGFEYPVSLTTHFKASIEYVGRYKTDAEWEKAIADATAKVVELTKREAANAAEVDRLSGLVANAAAEVDRLSGLVADAQSNVDDAQSDVDDIASNMSDPPTPAQAQALRTAQSALRSASSRLRSLSSSLRSAQTTLASWRSQLSTAQTTLKNTRIALFSAQAYLTQLNSEYEIWKVDKATCDRWNVATFYNPDPVVIADIDGNDYGNPSLILEQTNNTPCSSNGILEKTCNFKYEFPLIYITRYNGDINSYPTGVYYDGGRKFYTDLRGEAGILYNLDMEIMDISPIFKRRISYDCDYGVYNEFPSQGQSLYMYRPISLSNPFPGRLPGSNWLGYINYDFTKKNGKPVYDQSNIIYQVNLTPERIKSIKQYNQNYGYLDNVLIGDKNAFVHRTFKYIFEKPSGVTQ
jgi:hypothetical protein